MRRRTLLVLAAGLTLAAAPPALAQDKPATIRIFMPLRSSTLLMGVLEVMCR